MKDRALFTELGLYYPSFFRMELPFEYHDVPMEIYRLSPQKRGAFIHEYIHFLQDITTHFGMNNTYVCAEYLHSTINQIYKKNKKKIKIPINPVTNTDNVLLNIEVNRICTGDTDSLEDAVLVQINENNFIPSFKNSTLDNIPVYYLHFGREKRQFGGRAIMESMAYIIETKLEPHASGAKDYPYNSALMVANYFYPGFEKDLLRLLALCDISLMMSNPADIFIKYLKYYQQEDHMPTPFEIYDKFYNEFHSFSGKTCSVREGLLEFFYTMSSYLSSYVDEKVDTGFSAITKSLIYKGLNLRLNRPYFFVELASSGQLIYNHLFSKLLYDFGSPLIRDIKNHYSIYIPQNNAINNKSKYNFSLGMWTAIEQIYNTLYLGVDGCEMLEWCEGSKSMTNNAPIIDDRCINCPWKRCHDANLCPYAILWRHWNLSNIKVDKTSNS